MYLTQTPQDIAEHERFRDRARDGEGQLSLSSSYILPAKVVFYSDSPSITCLCSALFTLERACSVLCILSSGRNTFAYILDLGMIADKTKKLRLSHSCVNFNV